MQCRRLHSRAEGGEPRREHYAVHLAFSLINGGRAAANAGVVAAATAVFALVSYVLSFFFVSFSFFLSLSVYLSVSLSFPSFNLYFSPVSRSLFPRLFFPFLPTFVEKSSDFQVGKKIYRNRARSNSTLWNGRGKNKPKSSSNQQSLFLARFTWYRGRYGDAIIFT